MILQAFVANALIALPSGSRWDMVTAISTAASVFALWVGGFAAYQQLRHIRQSRQEELVLRLSAVFQDIIPPKRRIAAELLTKLIDEQDAGRIESVTHTQCNALADLLRFLETVYTAIKASPAKSDRRDHFPTDSVSLEFGRYAAGYGCALRQLGEPEREKLLELAMPHHDAPTRVFTALSEIVRHAEKRKAATAGKASGTSQRSAVSEPLLAPDEFPGWTRSLLDEFLSRETKAQSAEELSAAWRKRVESASWRSMT